LKAGLPLVVVMSVCATSGLVRTSIGTPTNLYFAPDPSLGTIRLAAVPDPSLASFPVALQEQFGLKLEATRGAS
jgi:hypothetical protein